MKMNKEICKMKRDKDGFVIVPCPFCQIETKLTYEENRIYKVACSNKKCGEVLTVTCRGMHDAYSFFKSLSSSYISFETNDAKEKAYEIAKTLNIENIKEKSSTYNPFAHIHPYKLARLVEGSEVIFDEKI